jgi:hypothetical protein
MNTLTKKEFSDRLVGKKLDAMFKNADLFWSLRDRWQDEREYEDFADYIQKVKKFVEKKGFIFIKMTKGFKITIQDLDVIMTLKINANDVDVSRIRAKAV